MLNINDYNADTKVTTLEGAYVNMSSTESIVVTGLNYVDLSQDITSAGAPFTALYFYTEKPSGNQWIITGRAAKYATRYDGSYSSASLVASGLNLVLNPGNRLLVIASRPVPSNNGGLGGSQNDTDDTGPTLAHFTFSGCSFSAS